MKENNKYMYEVKDLDKSQIVGTYRDEISANKSRDGLLWVNSKSNILIEKRRKIAFIMLRTNAPAAIYLDNKDYMNSKQVLRGFEWSVYTIENNRRERLYIADTWKQAKKWCVKEGYDFIDDDPSKELYESLIDLNK
tara:strand:- start:153 stop:563 length:411 start_codon:yes stop_codon:yes gene_type:complete